MDYVNLYQVIKSINNLNEKVTLLGIGPMSETVIDASIEAAIENDFPLFFIASRNQIDNKEFGSGYVESWDQYEFTSYVDKRIKELNFNGILFKCRDHGGPWQRDNEYENKIPVQVSMSNALDSYKRDIDAGFDVLHIDTSRDPYFSGSVSYELAVDRAVILMKAMEEYRLKNNKKEVYYEISLEKTSDNYSIISEFNYFTKLMIDNIIKNNLSMPVFLVGNTGALTIMGKNVGSFNSEIVVELKSIADKYNMILKEHNTDYLEKKYLEYHPELGIGMSNVAPEFAKLETEALMNLYELENTFFTENSIKGHKESNFVPIVYSYISKSKKCNKWFPNKNANVEAQTNKEFKNNLIAVMAHYFYSHPEVTNARKLLFENLKKYNICTSPEQYVKNNIKKGIQKYVDAFNLKNLTSKIYEQQKLEKVEMIYASV